MAVPALILEIAAFILSLLDKVPDNDLNFLLQIVLLSLGVLLALMALVRPQKKHKKPIIPLIAIFFFIAVMISITAKLLPGVINGGTLLYAIVIFLAILVLCLFIVLIGRAAKRGKQRGERKCVRCGSVLPENSQFCTYCGAPQTSDNTK